MNKKSDDRKNPKDLVNNYLPYIRILFLIDKINKPFIHSFTSVKTTPILQR